MPKKADETIEIDDPDKEIDIELNGADTSEDNGGIDAASEGAISLQEQLDAEKKRADDAERRATAAEADRVRSAEETSRTKADLTISHSQVIANALTAAETDRTLLRSAIRAAKEAGDYDAEVDALDRLGQLNVKVQRLNEGKAELESRAEQERERAAHPTDPVEGYIAQANLNPRAANWIRSHSEVVTDPRMTTKLTAAHWGALDDGLTEGTDDYFAAIEARMGYGERRRQSETVADTPAPQRRQAAPAAPVSRDGGAGGSSRPGTIRLTAEQREIARLAGISDTEYARSLADLQREGAITTH